MASSARSKRIVDEKPVAYDRFSGLESWRDADHQDTGNPQPLVTLENGFIDAVGQINRDPGADRIQSAVSVVHVDHYNTASITWVEDLGEGYVAKATTGSVGSMIWPKGSTVSSVKFNYGMLYFSRGQTPYAFDGTNFSELPEGSPLLALRPSFGVTVQSRLAIAGLPSAPATLDISRVNAIGTFSSNEDEDEVNVLRAGKIDISNLIGANESITGLASFETNKIIIFTGSRGLIYTASTNIDEWKLEDRTSITDGCISHNTIQEVGSDVLYCSRTGVFSVQRSRESGTVIYSMPMSYNIQILYRELLRGVPDISQISAVFDKDEYQYHIFFPTDGARSRRLTLTMNPADIRKQGSWSLTDKFIPARCGDFFEGSLLFGSEDGLYQIGKIEEEFQTAFPTLTVETPNLYLGSFTEDKEICGLMIAASGDSILDVEIIDPHTGKTMWSRRVSVEDERNEENILATPLKKRRRIPVNVRTQVCRLRVTATGTGLFRIAGFAFIIKTN